MNKLFEDIYNLKESEGSNFGQMSSDELGEDLEFELINDIAGDISNVFDRYFEPSRKWNKLSATAIKEIWTEAIEIAETHNYLIDEVLHN